MVNQGDAGRQLCAYVCLKQPATIKLPKLCHHESSQYFSGRHLVAKVENDRNPECVLGCTRKIPCIISGPFPRNTLENLKILHQNAHLKQYTMILMIMRYDESLANGEISLMGI